MVHGIGSWGSSVHWKQNLCPQLHSHDNSKIGVELADMNNAQPGAGQILSNLLCYWIEQNDKKIDFQVENAC